jgi:hypothetical protein
MPARPVFARYRFTNSFRRASSAAPFPCTLSLSPVPRSLALTERRRYPAERNPLTRLISHWNQGSFPGSFTDWKTPRQAVLFCKSCGTRKRRKGPLGKRNHSPYRAAQYIAATRAVCLADPVVTMKLSLALWRRRRGINMTAIQREFIDRQCLFERACVKWRRLASCGRSISAATATPTR